MSVTDVYHEAIKAAVSKGFGMHMVYSTKLEFVGQSYRFRQRLRQAEQQKVEGGTETG